VFGLFNDLERRLARVLAGALSGLFGGLLVLGGVGFLSVALWLFLSSHWGPVWAAVSIGGALVLLGLGVFATGAARGRHRPVETRAEDVTVSALVEAFIVGMNAGKAARPAPPRDSED